MLFYYLYLQWKHQCVTLHNFPDNISINIPTSIHVEPYSRCVSNSMMMSALLADLAKCNVVFCSSPLSLSVCHLLPLLSIYSSWRQWVIASIYTLFLLYLFTFFTVILAKKMNVNVAVFCFLIYIAFHRWTALCNCTCNTLWGLEVCKRHLKISFHSICQTHFISCLLPWVVSSVRHFFSCTLWLRRLIIKYRCN